MDGRWSANQFNTSAAISLITFLLRRNGFHLASVPAAGTPLEYFIGVWVVLLKTQSTITTERVSCMWFTILRLHVCSLKCRTTWLSPISFFITQKQPNSQQQQQGAGVLHMCCRSPGPQGGARSTDTGPAHEPAAGSLPAAGSTQHTVDAHQQLFVILSLRVWTLKLKHTNIHTGERC